MAEPFPPLPVKLICGMIAREVPRLAEAADALGERLGALGRRSEVWAFDFTDYYAPQMGQPLWRQFVAFEALADSAGLAEAKRATNDIERRFARRLAGQGPPRPINLDVGYLEPSKLVLASMKNFAHRIHLGRGVYGEITLRFERGRWTSLPWTFPDYASGRYDAFLCEAREELVRQLRQTHPPRDMRDTREKESS